MIKTTVKNQDNTRRQARIIALLHAIGYTVRAGTLHNTNGTTPRVSQLITRLYSVQ